MPAMVGDSRAELVSRHFNSVIISKRFCAERFFGILEEIQIDGYRGRQDGGGGDDEIPTVDALWGQSRKEEGRFLASV
jgi:hypothetical protein